MPRFFLSESFSENYQGVMPEQIVMTGEDAFHLSVSLRSRIGDQVTLCTSDGVEIFCEISCISGGKKNPEVVFTPLHHQVSLSESPVKITVFQGMPKGKKTDTVLQKCTELGADRIVFVYTDRSLPVYTPGEEKTERYQRIADEAAKQCGRGKLVSVGVYPNLEAALSEMKQNDLVFACYENEEQMSLRGLLAKKPYGSAAFLIGPEGGISEREVKLLQEENIPTVTLGNRILRTETASGAVLAMFLYENEL